MRLKDQTSSNAYIQVQSNLKFKLRFNGKRSFIKETFAIVAFLLFFDSVRVINYVSFYYFGLGIPRFLNSVIDAMNIEGIINNYGSWNFDTIF